MRKASMDLREILHTDILWTTTSSLLVDRMNLSAAGLFSHDLADIKKSFAARAKARAERTVCAVQERISQGEGVIP